MKLLGLVLLIAGVTHTRADVLGTLFSQELFGTVQLIHEYVDHRENAFVGLVDKDLRFTNEMLIEGIQNFVESYGNISQPNIELTPEDIKCIFQMAAFGEGLQNQELWALSMADSFAKVNSGYLRGNFRNFGHFSQCINIKVPMVEEPAGDFLHGRHCQVLLGQYTGTFEWPLEIQTQPPVLNM
jgi:Nose resistant-to-fluoxetine protein, N-terminal domain